MLKIRPITYEEILDVWKWRQLNPEAYRSPISLTDMTQVYFYEEIVSNPRSKHRYFALTDETDQFIGMGGLTDVHPVNRTAEISIVIDPDLRNTGLGKKSVHTILDFGFNTENLEIIYGECYYCNKTGIPFWEKISEYYNAKTTDLNDRKYWIGRYWDSLYFSINKVCFNATK